MKKHLLCLIIGAGGAALALAQPAADRDLLAKIRAEAFDRPQVAPVFDMFTVTIGPRLTASPAHKRAAEWARDRLASYGLDGDNAFYAALEFWSAMHGFVLLEMTGAMYGIDTDAVFTDMVMRLASGMERR